MSRHSERVAAEGLRTFWHSQIGRKLLIAILAFSTLVTLVIAASDLFLIHLDGVETIRERLRQIEVSHAVSLGEALQNREISNVMMQLRRIADLPDVSAVELRTGISGGQTRYVVSSSGQTSEPDQWRDIVVWCTCDGNLQEIGLLHVEASHANLRIEILRRAQIILAEQTLKTLLVAAFVLYLVHRLVTRRLLALTGAVARYSPAKAAPAGPGHDGGGDEFDRLVGTLDAMGRQLAGNDEELRKTAATLKAVVTNMPGTLFRLFYPVNGLKKLMMIEGGPLVNRGRYVHVLLTMSPEQFRDLSHPDDLPFLYGELPRRLAEENRAEFIMRRIGPEGKWLWLRTWERVVERREDGFITEGITLDVTDEMETKLALEASHHRYRDLVHALPVGVFENEPDRGCVYAGDLWSKLTGLSQEQLMGYGWTRAVHPDDHERVLVHWHRDMAARAVHHDEFRLCHVNGRESWVLTRALPRLDDKGRLLGYIGSIIDITDRRQNELAQQRLNTVLRMAAVGNEALMQQTNKMATYSTVCRLLVDMGGYDLAWIGLAEEEGDQRRVRRAAWAGASTGYLTDIDVRWDESPQGNGPTGRCIRTGRAYIVNQIARDPSMEAWRGRALGWGFNSVISLPLKTGGAVLGSLSVYSKEVNAFSEEEARVLEDFAHSVAFTVLALRERRRREEAENNLRQAQKLEALGLLAGSVAHDFNNLLGAIQGFAGFIAEDSRDGEPAAYYAQRILIAGKRGKALIGQILSFSRKLDMKRDLFPIGDLVAETAALLAASVPATTQCKVVVDPDIPPLLGDRDLLGQALLNLCMNANDALAGNAGTVAIGVRRTDPERDDLRRLADAGTLPPWRDQGGILRAATGTFDPTRPHLSVAVTDGGCGMDQTVLEHLFVPFFTTKQRGHGTGLGLAAVHRTVTAHGGAIVVESRPGGGSTFEIILPCDNEHPTAAAIEPRRHRSPTKAGGRVLLVDDNAEFGDMLLTALERRGFEVSPCGDPVEALAGIEEFPDAWDALITDQSMPNMSGLELIRSARAIRPNLACILCTGYAENALDDETLAEAGALALLRKPLDIDELVDRLIRAMPA